jgi:predicted nucleic acid-binding protein
MSVDTYLDTSALAKWYLNETGSEAFEAFMRAQGPASISSLTAVEFRCLLARRRRAGSIRPGDETRVYATFEDDVQQAFLLLHAVEDRQILEAVRVLELASAVPLRSLDALHLAVARDLGAHRVATADRVLAAGAEALGMEVVPFWSD